MSIKLNVCVACTLSDDNFDSRTTSISLEVELEPVVGMEAANLQDRSHRLLDVIGQALVDELDASRRGKGQAASTESLPTETRF